LSFGSARNEHASPESSAKAFEATGETKPCSIYEPTITGGRRRETAHLPQRLINCEGRRPSTGSLPRGSTTIAPSRGTRKFVEHFDAVRQKDGRKPSRQDRLAGVGNDRRPIAHIRQNAAAAGWRYADADQAKTVVAKAARNGAEAGCPSDDLCR
jgi:hypothetical protein